MEINTIGVVLSYYREQYGLSLAEICEGICSATTLFRMEQGFREMDSLICETLLARIGKQVVGVELLLNVEDYQLYLLRTEMNRRIEKDTYDGIEELLKSYRKLMPKKQSVHEQYCLYVEIMCMQKKGVPGEEITALIREALELTKPGYGEGRKELELYSEVELKLIFLLVQYDTDDRWKEQELSKMLLFIKRYDSRRGRERMEIRILMELGRIERDRHHDEKRMEYLDLVIRRITESRKITGLAEVHFEKAKVLERRFAAVSEENPEKKASYEKQYLTELKMAYYIALTMEENELLTKIKEFAEERAAWQITEWEM